MDKAKKKYYNERRKIMYGESESDEEKGRRGNGSDFIKLKQEVVELPAFHNREEELYFYDSFAYRSEKNKHCKMCFDKAFLEPGKKDLGSSGVATKGEDAKGLVFFEENEKANKDVKVEDVPEEKVEDIFKCLKKFPKCQGCGAISFDEEFWASA